MKTFIALVALACLSITGLHAQTGSRLVSAITFINFDTADSGYYTYTGSNGGDLTHTLNYSNQTIYGYNSNAGVDSFSNYEAVLETFNGNDYKIDSLTQLWDTTTGWTNYGRTLFNYDTNNRDTLNFYQAWDTTKWIGNEKTFYHYTNTKIDTVTTEDTLYSGGWIGNTKNSYAYNAHGDITDRVVEYWNTKNNTWLVSYNVQFLYYYDALNNDTAFIIQDYDTAGAGKWVNAYKAIFTYDAHHNPIIEVDYYWDTTALDTEAIYRTTYKYDANANDTSDVQIKYNTLTLKWDTMVTNSYTYNTYNQVTYHNYFNANLEEPYWEYRYHYEDFSTGVEQLEVNNNQLLVYPNPANGIVTLTSSKSINEITVTNLVGQTELKSPSGDLGVMKQTIDVSALPNGLYFVTATTNTGTVTQKFVVSR